MSRGHLGPNGLDGVLARPARPQCRCGADDHDAAQSGDGALKHDAGDLAVHHATIVPARPARTQC
jgi:hypothetical protein